MRFKEILLEYDRSKTLANFTGKIQARSKTDSSLRETDPEAIIIMIEEIDPTTNKQFVQWILRQWLSGSLRLLAEDGYRILNALEIFYNKKTQIRRAGRDVDINKYNADTLQDLTDQFQDAQSGKEVKQDELEKAKKESEILYDGDLGKLIVPKTEYASCFWGRGTRWCTASTEYDNYFDEYNRHGPLYIWINSIGTKYQFHFETRQFMDEKDVDIPHGKLTSLRLNHPVISKLFKKYKDQLLKSKNVGDIYMYANDVIKGRWTKAEPYIMKDPEVAYIYASYVIEGRWPEAEPYIMKSPYSAYIYANDVIKGRWTKAEPYIMKDPEVAYIYASYVIEGRWPEAEPYIKGSIYQDDYEEQFGVKL